MNLGKRLKVSSWSTKSSGEGSDFPIEEEVAAEGALARGDSRGVEAEGRAEAEKEEIVVILFDFAVLALEELEPIDIKFFQTLSKSEKEKKQQQSERRKSKSD